MCGQSWRNTEASVACAELGYSRAGLHNRFLQRNFEYLILLIHLGAFGRSMSALSIADHLQESVNYNCVGNETSLSTCPTSISGFCDTAATVQCQGR